MWFVPIAVIVILAIVVMNTSRNFGLWLGCTFAALAITGVTIAIDYSSQTTDTEVWSGRVVDWQHKEEWDEWHPPTEHCSTDDKGHKTCTTTPGYYEHHYAENRIKTTDNGWFSVTEAPNNSKFAGRRFNDSWPNTNRELQEMWPAGTPSASAHTYENKVQASYSIFRHKDINLKDFPDLPTYPTKVRDYINIDRIVGFVPNKDKALAQLAENNAEMNKMIPDSEKPGKTRSWKQVNLVFVNVGENKPQNYGFALQDKWENGNKNDYIISFSMDSQGKVAWVYPFSWTDVKTLEYDIRKYFDDHRTITDFTPVVNDITRMIEDQFVRKQMAEFSYIQIELSTTGWVFVIILNIVVTVVGSFMSVNFEDQRRNRNRYHY